MTSDDFSNLGIVLMKMNQPARALQALATAVAMDPSSPSYLFNQANALAAVGQFDQAEAAFRRCIALAPTLAGAHTGLGIVLAETGRLADALDRIPRSGSPATERSGRPRRSEEGRAADARSGRTLARSFLASRISRAEGRRFRETPVAVGQLRSSNA